MKKTIFLILFVIGSMLASYADPVEEVKEGFNANAAQDEAVCTFRNEDLQKLQEQKIFHDAELDAKADAFILAKTQEGAFKDLCSEDAKQVLIFQIAKMKAWHTDMWGKVQEFFDTMNPIVSKNPEGHPSREAFSRTAMHFLLMKHVKDGFLGFIENPEYEFATYCKNPAFMKFLIKMTLLWEEEQAAAWKAQGLLMKTLLSEDEIRETEAKAAAELKAKGVEPQYEWHNEQL